MKHPGQAGAVALPWLRILAAVLDGTELIADNGHLWFADPVTGIKWWLADLP